MYLPIRELERRNECFMACEGYKPSLPFNSPIGLNQDITAKKYDMNIYNQMNAGMSSFAEGRQLLHVYAANAYKIPMQTKLEAAKKFLKDHPCNPGVLNRWLDSRKTK